MDDLVAWHFNNNGQFTVRLAYKVFMADKKRSTERRGGGSASGTASRLDDPVLEACVELKLSEENDPFLMAIGAQ